MKNLFFGGSSDLAIKLAQKLNNTDGISSNNVKGCYRKFFKIKNYNNLSLKKLSNKIYDRYDNIIIFNGHYSSSFLSMFNDKDFLKNFKINFLIPIEISSFVIQNKMLKKNGAIFFISSIASKESLIGNAYYSIAKNSLNFSAKILANEQLKRNIRVNTISLGLLKNKMGLEVKKMTNTKKNYTSFNYVIRKIKILLSNKNINKKNVKII